MGKRAGLAHEHELAGSWLDPAESARQGPRGHSVYDDTGDGNDRQNGCGDDEHAPHCGTQPTTMLETPNRRSIGTRENDVTWC
jgi:hypothetical protein